MSEEQTVLVVDDDHRLVSLVRMYLEREGFGVFAAYDGQHAMDLYARHRPGFIILDLLLPKIDGITVCRQIRKNSNVPILMLTAKVEEVDKLVGLSVGADDYVTKPFSPRELVARVRAILRRATPATSVVPKLTHGDLMMDLERHEVAADGREVRLTPIDVVVDRTVDVHIGKLREKLGDDPARPRYIQTVRGVGYKLVGNDRAG
ncbi:MAG: response regulator transcription factor [Bacillati bacterium ANGP1]|uniref:Response regulator transcription factor n=1 Tax=Candidatus Segetimicrobium genomatis TaxID=2569760 RepID=A0A537JBT3_9BACT|nr:MAG: response regulator transcription factor [Terrabacteria group bacterium ANGP1]